MTRTEALIAAIVAELEARRAEVDADDSLSAVTMIVRMDHKTRTPSMVVWRPESQRVVRSERTYP